MTKKDTKSKKTTNKNKEEGQSLVSPNSTLTITLGKKDVKEKYQSVLKKLAKNLKLDGFRKGNVPAKIAEENLSREQVVQYVLEELVPDAYSKAIKAEKKAPITRPEFSITSTEEGKDWVVEAHFAELPEVSTDKYETHAKAGVKAGQKAIKETNKKNSEDKEKKDVKPLTKEQEKEITLQHIFRELVTQLKPQVPEMLLKVETQHEFEHISGQLKQLNMTVDEYLKRRQMSMEDLSQDLAVQTLSRLQLDLILGAIAKAKKLEVTDKDREDYFATIKDEKMREQVKKDEHYLGHLNTNLLKQKVVDHLLAIA
jgi:FKBP-type peptidyl-prolyl cis-trans isomerase (trigger factor)